MLAKRIIPCLDIKDGQTVKGINFLDLKFAGDPVELAKKYVLEKADELVFLDITATIDKRKTLTALVEKISLNINIPFTVGGGISEIGDVEILLEKGADKVSINSSAVKNPNLITELANRFGSQCIVLAIDAKKNGTNWLVYVRGGKEATSLNVLDWAKEAESRGAGEILLTSMDADGTKNGFDLELNKLISNNINIPVIASGGAGSKEHFKELFNKTNIDAGLAASIFHFGEVEIPKLKDYLKENNIAIRN